MKSDRGQHSQFLRCLILILMLKKAFNKRHKRVLLVSPICERIFDKGWNLQPIKRICHKSHRKCHKSREYVTKHTSNEYATNHTENPAHYMQCITSERRKCDVQKNSSRKKYYALQQTNKNIMHCNKQTKILCIATHKQNNMHWKKFFV